MRQDVREHDAHYNTLIIPDIDENDLVGMVIGLLINFEVLLRNLDALREFVLERIEDVGEFDGAPLDVAFTVLQESDEDLAWEWHAIPEAVFLEEFGFEGVLGTACCCKKPPSEIPRAISDV